MTQALQDASQSEPIIKRSNATQLVDSVACLDELASAICTFNSRFDDLTSHLGFIEKLLEARSTSKSNTSQVYESPTAQNSPELKFLCETNNGKALRKYLIKNRLQNCDSLCEELSVAIKASPNPARLVLDCFGKFFKQGIRAYEKNEYLSIEVDDESRCEAEERALWWRNRLISEGGILSACEMEARGLLYLIFSFEISRVFSDDDIWDLVVVSMKINLATLKRSPTLINSITSILKRAMKNTVKLEAIEIIRAFGMEEKFPMEMVAKAYIEHRNKYLNQRINESKTNPSLLKKAYANHVEVLKSALKCLKDNKFDALTTHFQEAITNAEKKSNVKKNKKRTKNEILRNAKRLRTQGQVNNAINHPSPSVVLPQAYRGVPAMSRIRTDIEPGFGGTEIELYSFVDKVMVMDRRHVYNSGSSVFNEPPSYLRL